MTDPEFHTLILTFRDFFFFLVMVPLLYQGTKGAFF